MSTARCFRFLKWKPYTIRRNYDSSGYCTNCPVCGSDNLNETVTDTIANNACEIDTYCRGCGAYVNFWAYGSFDPCFRYWDRSWPALLGRIQWRARRQPEP